MEQHPIPQQISSYQFRLVGDMTLKQFFELAGGALVSLLIYSLPFHPVIKWPLIIFFFALGAAMAFLPFQERPLEKWIIAFFRSVYSPTSYIWRQVQIAPAYFQHEEVNKTLSPQILATMTGANSNAAHSKLEEAETVFLNKLNTLFTPASNTVHAVAAPQIPSQQMHQNINIPTSVPFVPPAPQNLNQNLTTPNTTYIKPIQPVQVPHQSPIQAPVQPVGQFSYQNSGTVQPRVVVQEISPPTNIISPTVTNRPVFNSQNVQSMSAQFSPDAAPPHPAEKPNLIVGQVMDLSGKIVEGAILEIKDEQGRPVRALRSNKAGHFMIVTPLLNGKYQIDIEKDGLEFQPLTFETKGEIISPVAIKAKNSLVVN